MEKPVKILIVLTDSDLGGAEKIVLSLARGLSRDPGRRFEVKVFALKRKARTGLKLEAEKIPFSSFDLGEKPGLVYFLRALGAIQAWRKILQAESPDLVHGFLFQANLFARLSKCFSTAKNISSVRVIDDRRFLIVIDRLTSSLVDLHLAVSEEVKKWMAAEAGIPEAKIKVIKNGINLQDFPMIEKTQARSRLGLLENEMVVLTAGRLERQKGLDLLIRAGADALKQEPNLKFLIVGDGSARQSLVQLAKGLGVEQRFVFLEARPDISELLAAADIFALPSRWEGMPNVILEAMSMKVPIVATATGGVVEMVENEKEALLVPVENEAALSQGILRLAKDPGLAQKLATQARARVEREFSESAMIENYKELYLKMARGKN